MEKKITLIVIAVLLSMAIIACNPQISQNLNTTSTIIPIITISEAGSFTQEECQELGLENKVIMIESKYCGHCQEAKPIFQEACQEAGVTPEILDISEKEQREQMLAYSVEVKYTPTFIFNCNYYVGGMSKEEYIARIQG